MDNQKGLKDYCCRTAPYCERCILLSSGYCVEEETLKKESRDESQRTNC